MALKTILTQDIGRITYLGLDADRHDLPFSNVGTGALFRNLTYGTVYMFSEEYTTWYLSENPLSASSPAASYSKLAAPTLVIDSAGVVTWAGVTNAASYVYIKYDAEGVASDEAVAVSGAINLDPSESIKVKSIGATIYISSDYSAIKVFTVPTISYVSEYGTLPGDATNEATTITEANLPTLTETGYTFGGWYLESTFETLASIATEVTGDLTLYAKWTAIEYNITYNLDSGANDEGNQATYTIEDAIAFADATKDGYTFSGWFTEAAGAGTEVTKIELGSTGNVTLYAYFVATEYTITYNLYGATNHLDNPTTYDIETTTITLGDASKTSYTFDGWYDNTNFTGDAVTEIPLGSTGDVVLYAKLTAIEYTLAYDFGTVTGVTNPNETLSFTVEDLPIALSAPSKENYVFDAWYEEDIYTTPITSLTAENYEALIVTDTVTLYGKLTYSVAVALSELDTDTTTDLGDVAEVLTLTTTFPTTINAVLDDVYHLDYKLDFSGILVGITEGSVSISAITYGGASLTLDTTAGDILTNQSMYLSEYVTDFTRDSVVDSENTAPALVVTILNESGSTLAGDVVMEAVVSNDDFVTETQIAIDTEQVSIIDVV